MQDLGVSDEVVDKVLNHKLGGIRGRYGHSTRDPQKAKALAKWSKYIEQIVSGKLASNVVTLSG